VIHDNTSYNNDNFDTSKEAAEIFFLILCKSLKSVMIVLHRRRLSFLTSAFLTFLLCRHVESLKRWQREITVIVTSGQEDCYFLPNIPKSSDFEIAYEVRPLSNNKHT
jgi:hypothetical protein